LTSLAILIGQEQISVENCGKSPANVQSQPVGICIHLQVLFAGALEVGLE
jgi:hypothetical protein